MNIIIIIWLHRLSPKSHFALFLPLVYETDKCLAIILKRNSNSLEKIKVIRNIADSEQSSHTPGGSHQTSVENNKQKETDPHYTIYQCQL